MSVDSTKARQYRAGLDYLQRNPKSSHHPAEYTVPRNQRNPKISKAPGTEDICRGQLLALGWSSPKSPKQAMCSVGSRTREARLPEAFGFLDCSQMLNLRLQRLVFVLTGSGFTLVQPFLALPLFLSFGMVILTLHHYMLKACGLNGACL